MTAPRADLQPRRAPVPSLPLAHCAGARRPLQVPPKTIYTWRYKGIGPPAVPIGRYLRFRAEDVAAWLESRADNPSQVAQQRGEHGRCLPQSAGHAQKCVIGARSVPQTLIHRTQSPLWDRACSEAKEGQRGNGHRDAEFEGGQVVGAHPATLRATRMPPAPSAASPTVSRLRR